jgi:hypothetical protein
MSELVAPIKALRQEKNEKAFAEWALKSPEEKEQTTSEFLAAMAFAERKVLCPVRSHYFGEPTYVKEYAVPVDKLGSDKNTQPRKSGRDQKKVAEVAESFMSQGQNEGVCVEVIKEELRLRWGSHREEAVETLKSRSEAIKGLPVGYIWVNAYNYQISELRKFQSIENNLTKPKQPASEEDNLSTLEDEAASGHMDKRENGVLIKFVDMPEEMQRKELEEYVKKYMPAAIKKKTALIQKFFTSKSNPYKSDTMSRREMVEYYNNNNDLGLKFEAHATTTPDVVDESGVRHKLVVMDDPMNGANLQSIQYQRIKDKVDVVHIVISLKRNKLKNEQTMKAKRAADKQFFETWHEKASKVKVVDFLYHPPQSDPERQAALTNVEPWISVTVY